MKNIKLLLIGLVATFALSGCGDSSEDNPGPGPIGGDGSVVGDWHMVSWSTLAAADIYVSFGEGGSFKLYQRLYTPEYVCLDGTYSYSDRTLSGVYTGNLPWGSSYRASFNADGTQMTLTSTAREDDVAVYVKAEIPSEIVSGAVKPSLKSRASEDMPRFF